MDRQRLLWTCSWAFEGCMILLLLFPVSINAIGSVVSIVSATDFTAQRPCVTDCLIGYGLPGILKCGNPLLDSCYCRSDLQSTATPWLSSCANNYCSGLTIDVNNAVSLYTAYCATAGREVAKPETTTAAGGGAGLSTFTITKTVITANGMTTTSPVAPFVTIINQNDPSFNYFASIGNGNGNVNVKNGARTLRVDLYVLTEALGLGTLLVVIFFL